MVVDGKRFRERRKRAGLTQVTLAERAGVSLSTVKSAERERSLGHESLRRLALALGCQLASLLRDIKRFPKRDIPRFLLQQSFPEARYKVVQALREGAVDDMRREFDSARLRYEQALERHVGGDPTETRQVIIRSAISLDNAGQSAQALKMLENEIHGQPWPKNEEPLLMWFKYHAGLARRRLAEAEMAGAERQKHLEEGETLLRQTESLGDPEQRIAAIHQLGCLYLVRARFESRKPQKRALLKRAARFFEDAAKKWRKKQNFREGYPLRRLADLARARRHERTAFAHLLSAFEVFVRHDCYRYADAVRAELEMLLEGKLTDAST